MVMKTLNGTIAREQIQCRADNGKVGSFLITGADRRVSPVFDSLTELYTWARENGWKSDSGAYVYFFKADKPEVPSERLFLSMKELRGKNKN